MEFSFENSKTCSHTLTETTQTRCCYKLQIWRELVKA